MLLVNEAACKQRRRHTMEFLSLTDGERAHLLTALRGNAEERAAILTDRRDTSFKGMAEDVTDDEVIMAIQSVPCHY
jgi:hypothetical protein